MTCAHPIVLPNTHVIWQNIFLVIKLVQVDHKGKVFVDWSWDFGGNKFGRLQWWSILTTSSTEYRHFLVALMCSKIGKAGSSWKCFHSSIFHSYMRIKSTNVLMPQWSCRGLVHTKSKFTLVHTECTCITIHDCWQLHVLTCMQVTVVFNAAKL